MFRHSIFSQTEWKAINDDVHYSVGSDSLLEEALKEGREKTSVCAEGASRCSDCLSILAQGVASVILRHSTPRPVRAKIAELLNAKRERSGLQAIACASRGRRRAFCLLELRFQWTLNEDGTVDTGSSLENTDYCSQFEWLSQGNGCGAGSGGPIEPGGAEFFFYSFASKPRRSIAWSGPTLESRTASESRADV